MNLNLFNFPTISQATICPCSSNVCQLRLDFNNFVISGPVTTSDLRNKATAGAVFASGAVSVNGKFKLFQTVLLLSVGETVLFFWK